ncbi:MAG: penicillin-insensitive murein endopeptidase [Polyangiaceae bacterium]|nr:penicillin-insensitive murein endopeptidase [Polyangiaceae bacterium]
MFRRAGQLLLLLLSIAMTACFGAPNPLAPLHRGSVGLPHDGRLLLGKELPREGEGYRVICYDGLHYGTSRLVNVIERAAARVALERPGGSPLAVCDLSAPGGGRLSRHRSHQSGRDVDLLFYALTPDGRPSMVQFVRFGTDGLAEPVPGSFVRLDIERQWLLVRALLTDPQSAVQWMFIAHPIEALLIEYARARGEDPELVWRAEQVMIEPWDSLPHDDHIHLRLACTPDEAIAGCLGGGPYWPWLSPIPQLAPLDDAALFDAIAGDLAAPQDPKSSSKVATAP